MNANMVVISKDEYKKVLELAYKASMLKEALLNGAKLDIFRVDSLSFYADPEVAAIFKYAFPEDYERKLRELQDEKKADDSKEGADDER